MEPRGWPLSASQRPTLAPSGEAAASRRPSAERLKDLLAAATPARRRGLWPVFMSQTMTAPSPVAATARRPPGGEGGEASGAV